LRLGDQNQADVFWLAKLQQLAKVIAAEGPAVKARFQNGLIFQPQTLK